MHNDRLQHLITILENLTPDQLDMSMWTNECGTVCCAAGWAAQDMWFNSLGLRLDDEDVPVIEGVENPWASLRIFFDIDRDDANHIFDPAEYFRNPTPAVVIARIREVLNETA